MNKTILKIAAVLTFVVILPALFFLIYEFSKLNEDEELINTVYTRQLNSIIFSVNQYSSDISRNWASDINIYINENKNNPDKLRNEFNSFLNKTSLIRSIFIVDSLMNQVSIYNKNLADPLMAEEEIKDIFQTNSQIISRLFTYEKGGYRKIEPLECSEKDCVILIFVLDNDFSGKRICGVAIDPEEFINQSIVPRLQSISTEEFIIIVSKNDDIIFSTSPTESSVVQSRESMWLLPNFSIGIQLKGKTIESLVQERTTESMVMISILTFILFLGVIFVYRTIKKEVELAQIKSDFVSNVSHELRTPLALISMFAETLELGRVKTEEKKQEYYTIISHETNRLGRIVNTILNFSKMEDGKRKYSFEKNDINELIEKVISTYSFHLQNKGFNFKTELTENLPFINIDSEAVSEAVINLIDNAVKYSDENKEITLRSGIENKFVYAEVEDKGIGITEEDQKRIFEKFFRVTSGLVHNTKGTGLGLTLVQKIMEAHKGKIELRSKLGKGSTFKLFFPAENND
ncbi:MAG: HAMP domain-containing histidine kinase [Melioribacteraceae bacterium]|nr:HAMP domain-containing histidine kinase [Melioribacteraceae bacterium]MCF8355921.1 HAMP domain-containing histidine kinase [Melioribacteraceae bacterium]MCF8395461.1 HAMP domain-containing histidine kinase [Melioribacteraceae bacterium]MCF8420785.1 HAMP domain-containing histidine kinase [Melioribacteraceae bacterium]